MSRELFRLVGVWSGCWVVRHHLCFHLQVKGSHPFRSQYLKTEAIKMCFFIDNKEKKTVSEEGQKVPRVDMCTITQN
jgi:hypothetical protein